MNFLKGLFGGKNPQDDSQDFEETQHVLPPSSSPFTAPPPSAPPAPVPPAPPVFRLATRTPTTLDFSAVLKSSGVDAEQQQRVKKAQDLLRSLPEDSPAAMKRQIVEAAFTAFDVPTQKIIDAATLEVHALEAFIAAGGAATQQIIDDGSERIAELEAEIAEIRASMATAVADQKIRDGATEVQINGVKPIIAFFAQAPGTAAAHTFFSPPAESQSNASFERSFERNFDPNDAFADIEVE